MHRDSKTGAALEQEIQHLREQVANLTQERDEAQADRQWMYDLLEQSNVPICLWHGNDYVYKFANSAYLYGSGKHDAVGKPIREVFEEHEIPGLLPILDQVYTSGRIQFVHEALLRLKNPQTGEVEDRWFDLIYNPVRNMQGDVIGASNFALEVTEQVRARQALHRQAQILDQIRGSVIVTDMHGTIINWNKASTTLYGYTSEEAIGQPIALFYPPEERDRLVNDLVGPLQEHGELELETVSRDKDGQNFPIHLSLSLLRDDSGSTVGMIGYSIDITERKAQEKELLIFKAMIENAPDGFALADMQGITTYANPAYLAMLGYGKELLGQPILHGLNEDPQHIASLMQHVSTTGAWQGELTYQRADGSTFPGQASSFMVYDADGQPQGIGGIARDITERKQAEAEHVALQEQVIEAQRAALRELSAPLLPIAEHVVILPLIGSLDTQRAQQIMETLLEGVAQYRADVAIVDITGIQVVDTQVANALIQTARAVQLLGAQVVLTGIGPAMAQTLVSLGADLSNIVTRGTLQSGIAYALQ
jgi:rsbT co-antagonist protein RsbR